MRYSVGLQAAAAIVIAAWIDAGEITQGSTNLAIDHNKIKRAQENLTKSVCEKFSKLLSTAKIDCIFFDGRIHMTKTMLCKEDSVKSYPATIKEEHYTVCSEPEEIHLFHFTLNKTTHGKKCAVNYC